MIKLISLLRMKIVNPFRLVDDIPRNNLVDDVPSNNLVDDEIRNDFVHKQSMYL